MLDRRGRYVHRSSPTALRHWESAHARALASQPQSSIGLCSSLVERGRSARTNGERCIVRCRGEFPRPRRQLMDGKFRSAEAPPLASAERYAHSSINNGPSTNTQPPLDTANVKRKKNRGWREESPVSALLQRRPKNRRQRSPAQAQLMKSPV